MRTVGDTAPNLTGTFAADGTAASAVANVARPDGTVFSHAVVLTNPTPSSTAWSMPFSDGDLNQAGVYRVELQVTFGGGGGTQTFYFDADGQYNYFPVRDQIA
jgi:hypothetical protein